MPSQDDYPGRQTGPVPVPGLSQQEAFSRPLVMGDGLTRPLPATVQQPLQPPATDQLPAFSPQAGQFTNTNLTRVLTTTLPRVGGTTTSQRIPVVIQGARKKRQVEKDKPHRWRRLVVTLVGVLLVVLITSLTMYTVTPLGHDQGLNWNPFKQPANGLITNQNTGLSKLVAQATATAVYHKQTDGLSGGAAQIVGNGAGSLNWPVGQCTYWANSRYHALTGYWVSWSGNADQWVAGARAAGWNVSTSPHVPSIIVLMAGVQLASSYGHVAVVESIVAGASPVTVHTSNMNWYNNGGGWDKVSYEDFTVGSGVYFIWHK
jgi:surface antigen